MATSNERANCCSEPYGWEPVKRTQPPFEGGAGAALGGMGDRHGCRPDECPGEFGRALNDRLEQFPVEIRREIADDSGTDGRPRRAEDRAPVSWKRSRGH